ncbi:MAG: aldo/keto reductase, partial [Clostridia bacterium]|nr:aldo/keto reductase [Clostridia bacterium]
LKEAKEKGLIGHIGVTGHNKEFLLKIMESGEVETVQFPFNPVETNGVQEIIDLADEMDIGTIVMKPLAGGAITNADLALRYLFDQGVTTAIPGMDTISQVEENAMAGGDGSPLSAKEREELLNETDKLGTTFCRRCEYCLPCPEGIPIPSIFLFEGYYTRYGLKEWSMDRYLAMEAGPSDCTECGECEDKCPYELPIREMLKRAAVKMCG